MINSLQISINSSRSTISLPLGVSVSQWGFMTPHLIMCIVFDCHLETWITTALILSWLFWTNG